MLARYLDHAATSPVRAEVLEAMLPHLAGPPGNPSSRHEFGARASDALEDARTRVARVLGVRRGDVVFTSGGTEANNLAVKGISLARALPGGARHLVTTPIEHPSILESAAQLERLHGFETTLVPVDGFGRVDPARLAAAVRDDTALVAVGWANNEIGTVQDAAGIAAALRGSGVPLHLDAVQAAGWLPLAGAGQDAIALAGHKLGAPQGTGVFAVRGRVPLEPLLSGGGQERGRRSGTEPVWAAVALATALELAERERERAARVVGDATRGLIREVLAAVPGARLTGHPEHRLPGTASFVFEGVSGEAVLVELERRGIAASSGSACAAGRDDPSHVLLAIGLDPALALTAVRLTLPRTLDAPVEGVAGALADAVRAARTGGRA